MIPIEHFLDHGDSMETENPERRMVWEAYKAVATGKRTTLKPGDKLPVKGLDTVVISSNGQIISARVRGGGAMNPNCAGAQQNRSTPPRISAAPGSC